MKMRKTSREQQRMFGECFFLLRENIVINEFVCLTMTLIDDIRRRVREKHLKENEVKWQQQEEQRAELERQRQLLDDIRRRVREKHRQEKEVKRQQLEEQRAELERQRQLLCALERVGPFSLLDLPVALP
jgi:vacuolar-type H+-ATPase subunit I/STV1